MYIPRPVRTLESRGYRSVSRAAIETLESRQLLSAVLPDPIATPLDVATPLTGTLADGTSTPSAISPSQFDAAYGINNIKLAGITGNGAGQTIAIVVANDDPGLVNSSASNFNTSDLHMFDQQLGLPDPPSFTKIEQYSDGSNPAPDTGWAEEASLDVEWTHAVAPQAKIVLFEAHDAGAVQLLNWGVQSAADYAGVSVVSMSFGFGEFYGETDYDNVFTTPSGHSGVTFVAATGDQGAPGDYPAFSPDVVAVGGTHLNLTSSGGYSSETGYSSSGGGISAYEPKPSFQSALSQSSSSRLTPDVSIDGDPNTGVDVYDSYNGGYANKWYKIGGTSLSTPAWAGLIAIADQGRASAKLSALTGSQTLSKIYSIPSTDFHDITSGNNGYSAGTGYDLVSGRGSPIANLLEPDLSGVAAGGTVTTSNTAAISGEIYIDANSNGKLDSGESPFSGIKIYLDSNNDGSLDNGEYYTVVGSSGTYNFGDLPAGTYHIREVVPSGYELTNPTSGVYNITVASGQKVTGENWGNKKIPLGSFSGYIYQDNNGNKKYDSGDKPMAGVKIFIDNNKNGKLDSGEYETTTNSSGYFSFGDLPAGTYQFVEIIPSGYHTTNVTNGIIDVTLSAGEVLTNEDLANVK
jgi:subtilase family serine protease